MKKEYENLDRVQYIVETDKVVHWIVVCFVCIEFALILLDLILAFTPWIPVIELQKIFDMTRERSTGTWLSVTLSLLCGIALLMIFFAVKACGCPKKEAVGWFFLSVFFVYMSVDDAAWIHERSGDFLDRLVSSNALPYGLSSIVGKFPTYYWFLIMGPFFAAMGLFMLSFLWQRFGKLGLRKYIIFPMIGLAGALLIDFAEGTGRGIWRLKTVTGMSERSVFHLIRLTEESLEILSIILLLLAFMKYLSIILKDKHILISK
ncbi:MAG: hypothetical protein K9M96_17645 [Deltaproteobacteria bacterium]|nr:hypothetical protein [Deltaproteobacteria bacterium]